MHVEYIFLVYMVLVDMGDDILPGYVVIIIYHDKDPVFKQPVFHGKYLAVFFFFRGSFGLL